MGHLKVDVDLLRGLMASRLEGGNAVDALAGLCVALGIDPTLLPLTATTTGRVTASMGRQVTLREAAVGCGAIQTISETETAVPAALVCIDPQVPSDIEGALVTAGVELDAVGSLYFHPQHGPTFRQRIKSKFKTFTELVSRGLVTNPTGFFVSAVRENWLLSSSYEPGRKKAAMPARTRPGAVEADVLDQTLAGLEAADPAAQWEARGGALRFLLRGWANTDLARLELACRAGRLSAARLAREAAQAAEASTLSGWGAHLRSQLSGT